MTVHHHTEWTRWTVWDMWTIMDTFLLLHIIENQNGR